MLISSASTILELQMIFYNNDSYSEHKQRSFPQKENNVVEYQNLLNKTENTISKQNNPFRGIAAELTKP